MKMVVRKRFLPWLATVALLLALAGVSLPMETTYAKTHSVAASTPQLGWYNSPDWWHNQTCDKGHYPSAFQLTTWRGIQVCGPLPGVNSTGILEPFPNAGVSQYEFQCTELIARYLWSAYKLKSQIADGSQIVSVYTNISGTPFRRVDNDGTSHTVPVEGDVLSYGPSPQNSYGHTSIVVASNVSSSGNGAINVIEQNIGISGIATLTMTNWKIQPDANHFGTVSSWMTPRAKSTPFPFSGTWSGYGYYNNQTFDMQVTITSVSGNAFQGTLREDVYNGIVAIKGYIRNGGKSVVFTSYRSLKGNKIALNCWYSGDLLNSGTLLNGTWQYPTSSLPDGAFELRKH